jgi:hypothetical protein
MGDKKNKASIAHLTFSIMVINIGKRIQIQPISINYTKLKELLSKAKSETPETTPTSSSLFRKIPVPCGTSSGAAPN